MNEKTEKNYHRNQYLNDKIKSQTENLHDDDDDGDDNFIDPFAIVSDNSVNCEKCVNKCCSYSN